MDSSADRRGFLTRLAAAGLAAALPTAAGAAGAAGEHAAPADWDDSWTARVRAAKHKAVFDSPDPLDGLALTQAVRYRDGYEAALGAREGEVVPVVVLRHFSTVLAWDDALWSKYQIAEWRKIKHGGGETFPAFNPLSRPHTDEERREGRSFVEAISAAGGVVLVCNLAATALAGQLARLRKVEPAAMQAEARAGLVPGAILQPNGIYAVARAQEAGCVYMRSS